MSALPSVLSEPVLVLNRGYTATRVISVRQAFVLLFREIAEVISVNNGVYETFNIASWLEIAGLQRRYELGDHDWIRAASRYVAAPRIIRITSSNRQPDFHVKLNRRNLFARDRNKCQYCGRRFAVSELSIDHVIPVSRGGGNTWQNLVCACVTCNTRKGNRTPREAGLRLVNKPRQPRHCPDRALSLRRKQYEVWKVFLNEAYWTVELRD
ncbi:MAG: HNH endonuclease [Phycisphaerales bacterium]|nr:HNH endonuclease [Phycisphaerales bacterium]